MITRDVKTIGGSSGATFSDCGVYRYRLWREWDATLPRAVFCLTNPSTADEIENDPTVERQCRRVLQWDQPFGRIDVVNAFAYRETYSNRLPWLHRHGIDLVGPENDAAIIEACRGAGIVICGWGEAGLLGQRHEYLIDLMRSEGIASHALAVNDSGCPKHPLYLRYGLKPFPL